jgi:hypothetical protein
LADIGWVDIVIDHDDVFAEVSAGGALGGERHHLRCMAGIHLFD